MGLHIMKVVFLDKDVVLHMLAWLFIPASKFEGEEEQF